MLTEEVWDNARDLVTAITANGFCKGIFDDLEKECETMPDTLKPIRKRLMTSRCWKYCCGKRITKYYERQDKLRRKFELVDEPTFKRILKL